MNVLKVIGIGIFLISATTVFAESKTLPQSPEGISRDAIFETFQNVMYVPPVSVVVPTVVELPVDSEILHRNGYAIYERASERFVPYYIHETFTKKPAIIHASFENRSEPALTDGFSETNVEFFLQEQTESTAIITLSSDELVESSSLVFELDRYVALPVRISISARVNGVDERVIVAPTSLMSPVVMFPKTVANTWTITLTHIQPLRINELRLVQDSVEGTVLRGIRFLAQPNASYEVYHNPDRSVRIPTLEQGNLTDDRNVKMIDMVSSEYNSMYRQADVDGDGVIDIRDNCVQMANKDQTDIDRNGRGDACDDFDRDGFTQNADNCPNHTNAMQEDTDGDGMGDACDTEESRFTEKYTWVPWAGMGVALLVLCALFMLVGMTPKNKQEN